MRIIFVTSKLNFISAGGSITDTDLKAENIKAMGHDVSVLTVYAQNNIITKTLPYRLIEERFNTRYHLRVQYQIWKVLKKYSGEADIFHVEGQYMLGAGLYRWLRGAKPIVLHFNREYFAWRKGPFTVNPIRFFKQRIRYLLERLLAWLIANKNDHFMFNTPFLRDAFERFGLNFIRPATIMPDFVDEQRLFRGAGMNADEAQRLRRERAGDVHLYATGRLIPEKGFDVLIRALAALLREREVQLTLGGQGPELERLKNLAAELGVADMVSFPGWVSYEQMAKFLAASDAFILPRWHHEVGSVILLEAMAFGLPCIVMDGGALEWLVGRDDLTFSAGDAGDLAKKIDGLVADSARRLSLGQYCRDRFVRTFHIKTLAPQLESVFTKVAAGSIIDA